MAARPGAARPVVFGEILFDRFPDGTRALGGAPLNVAVHLAGLGHPPHLVSRVGTDDAGDEALETLTGWGVDCSGVQRDPSRPTGAVRVELADGEPSFEILPDQAYDHVDAEAALAALDDVEPSLLYHGTLAARRQPSRFTLTTLRDAVAAPTLVDVNLRPPWTPRQRCLELCAGARWVKVNRDELRALLGRRQPIAAREHAVAAAALRNRLAADELVVTGGRVGAWQWTADGDGAFVPAPEVAAGEVVDAVGAGDGFSAALLTGHLEGWPAEETLRRAAELAAAVCRLRGALPADRSFYHDRRREWEG